MPHCKDNAVKRRKVLITDFFNQEKQDNQTLLTKGAVDEPFSSGCRDGTLNTPGSKMTRHATTETTAKNYADPDRPNSADSGPPKPLITQFDSNPPFDKADWVSSLTSEEKELLDLEIEYLHHLWLAVLYRELTKPYFLQLKRFLAAQKDKTVFPPRNQIYSWLHLTPLSEVKCLILGQDPYHNHSQAHGLAFSVLEPTRPPPSLMNIYKTLSIDFPTFIVPDHAQLTKEGKPGGGNLTKWAQRGVLMLNAALTVEAHKPNSHAKKGWEQFTEQVIRVAIQHHSKEIDDKTLGGFVIMAWGSPAQKRIKVFESLLAQNPSRFKVLCAVHPSPLSAHRGFFDLKVFKSCNEWLALNNHDLIDWGLIDGNVVK